METVARKCCWQNRLAHGLTPPASQRTDPVAETLAEKQLEMLSGDLATRVELAQVEANLTTELATTRTSLVKWMVTVVTAYTAAIAAPVSALARFLAG